VTPNTPEYILTPAGIPKRGARSAIFDDAAEIPGRAVAAAEEDQINAELEKPLGGGLGVLLAGFLRSLVYDLEVGETDGSQAVGAHGAGAGEPLDIPAAFRRLKQASKLIQGRGGLEVRGRLRAKLDRGLNDAIGIRKPIRLTCQSPL
jgi:hypothetical protein